ncbi:hypothetical protein SAMN05216503_0338 [Polaribacter sp. KT25b]|uniref:hypothetical protein n=1 Tax=Polaribacter sp. KT25b TaxID=1855336 RepID=UPI00087BD057|nr:hypothetical protein [Polaribacter sp. KT25b]SDR67902.1 hypothetical protein SAMN05216503_0338 [Polaribacter sp. KT25b]
MKKSILLLILILTLNCSSTNTKKHEPELSFEEKIDLLEYNLILPFKWHPYLDIHKDIAFSPLITSDKNSRVHILIMKIPPSEHNDISLKEIAEKGNKNLAKYLTVYGAKITTEQSKFGETCINTYSYTLNSNKIKLEKTYFKFQEDYYCFIYASDESLFPKYYTDSKKIFESLKFKE